MVNPLRVVDSSGQVVSKVGDKISLGGGDLPKGKHVADCPISDRNTAAGTVKKI